MKTSVLHTVKIFQTVLPILIGILLLVNLIEPLALEAYHNWFNGNIVIDTIVGAFAGSISFGIPVTSYIVGGELLQKGVSLAAVTSFVMAWTTVGLAMMPLEASFLGLRFALVRNTINFFMSLLMAAMMVFTLGLLS